ncbi:MAG: uncharacterized protein OJF49_002961 [Ktedonobacterales bacterium]|jgi:predicted transport protein|nr:MAG: uncharacterized protein OJF49_002961 [Ktedonobacterales bacterium]
MTDIKLFRIGQNQVCELAGQSVAIEKTLQEIMERHLDALLGVRFLASEYSTGKVHGGRIDTLGIDENGSPVIVEYKRASNQNVINQGLFYLDWLLDHHKDFEMLVLKRFGPTAEEGVDWRYPRLLCIAGDFTKYDEKAVQQIPRNIELIRYKRYGNDLLLLDLVNSITEQPLEERNVQNGALKSKHLSSERPSRTVSDLLVAASIDQQDRYEAIKAFLLALGDDVQVKTLAYYFAFRRIKNFACVEIHPQAKTILVYVKGDPDMLTLDPGFTRDVRKIGHFGTGDLEITIRSDADFERAQPLLLRSYEQS